MIPGWETEEGQHNLVEKGYDVGNVTTRSRRDSREQNSKSRRSMVEGSCKASNRCASSQPSSSGVYEVPNAVARDKGCSSAVWREEEAKNISFSKRRGTNTSRDSDTFCVRVTRKARTFSFECCEPIIWHTNPSQIPMHQRVRYVVRKIQPTGHSTMPPRTGGHSTLYWGNFFAWIDPKYLAIAHYFYLRLVIEALNYGKTKEILS
jgi:hypothetical protein